MDVFQKVKPKS